MSTTTTNSYLKGIKINFISNVNEVNQGASFDLSEYITDSNSLMQNTLINSYLQKGSDKLNPDRGTDLINDSWKTSAQNYSNLVHIGNFADSESSVYVNDDILTFAADSPLNMDATTLEAVNNTLENMNEPLINSLSITPTVSNGNVIYNTIIKTTKNETIGKESIIKELLQ